MHHAKQMTTGNVHQRRNNGNKNTTSRFPDYCHSSEVTALLISCEVAPFLDASASAGDTGIVNGSVPQREEASNGRNASCTSASVRLGQTRTGHSCVVNPSKVRQTDTYE